MTYVDGFVIAVPAAKQERYRSIAEAALPLFKEFGAIRMVETWGDDVPDGEITDFRKAVKATPDEVIVFSWVVYPSREIRDAATQRMMNDPRMEALGEMPFDAARMIFGGFEVISEAGDGGPIGYVDGFLVAISEDMREEYKLFAERTSAVFLEHGATRLVDGWSDDVRDGKVTDFRRAVRAEAHEAVLFGWVEWPSKAVRDEAWGKVMAAEQMDGLVPPFDGKRMVYGGFKPILDA